MTEEKAQPKVVKFKRKHKQPTTCQLVILPGETVEVRFWPSLQPVELREKLIIDEVPLALLASID